MPPTTPRMIRAAIVLYQEPDAFLQMQIMGCRTVRLSSQVWVWLSSLSTLAFAGWCWTLKNARRLFAHARPRHQLNLACLCIWILPSLTRQGKCLKKACFDSSTNNWKPTKSDTRFSFRGLPQCVSFAPRQPGWANKDYALSRWQLQLSHQAKLTIYIYIEVCSKKMKKVWTWFQHKSRHIVNHWFLDQHFGSWWRIRDCRITPVERREPQA